MAAEKRLHKFHQGLNMESSNKYIKTKKRSIFERANIEINRIIKRLNLPISLKNLIIEKFMNFWSSLNPGSKFRNLEMLVPMAIYNVLNFERFPSSRIELLETSKISNKDFSTLERILQK
jgi:hypothetical protein